MMAGQAVLLLQGRAFRLVMVVAAPSRPVENEPREADGIRDGPRDGRAARFVYEQGRLYALHNWTRAFSSRL